MGSLLSAEETAENQGDIQGVPKKMASAPITVLISGAAGQIGYAMLPMVASGQMFGPDQEVIIHALEVPFGEVPKRLNGVAMEMQDCSYPLLKGFKQCFTDKPEEAWTGIDYAVLVGGFPRKKGMLRADLLQKNANIFKTAGECLEKYAKESVKVLVIANPANTNCRVLAEYAPKIPKENFCALTRLDYNRACGLISSNEGCAVSSIKNMVIWGNHSKSQVPDVSYVTIEGKGKLLENTERAEYYTKPTPPKEQLPSESPAFMEVVQYRGAEVIKARGASSACSAANAGCNNIRDWVLGTTGTETVAMSVWSNGNPYGIADGIFYSFPCTVADGKWTIADNFTPTDTVKELMKASEAELLEEWKTCQEFLASQ